MFTGIVLERGRLSEEPAPSAAGGVRLVVGHSAALGARLGVGASLAVSGVCLTVTAAEAECSVVELSPETLARTTLGGLRRGSAVNLEPPLRLGDPLGGHWVQGHVDATLEVVGRRDLEGRRDSEEVRERGEHRVLAFALPAAYVPLVVEKGSVALDGVSLTVSALGEDRFEVALIPHTLAVTTLGERRVGERVNFEADVLAKYVQRLAAAALAGGGGPAGGRA
jgi:riboflavin synthase alpha subunit